MAAWLTTIVVIGWFAVVTRAEPSIVRASVMAGMAATMTLVHRNPDTGRILAWTVTGLLLVDPMLAHSVGFALSVGATAGLVVGAQWWSQVIGAGQTFGATIAAQVGVAPVTLLIFGTIPVVSLVANPLAIPVAGAVMTIGLPLAVLGHVVPSSADLVAMVIGVPVGWVDLVARTASAWSPRGWWHAVSWCAVAVALSARARARTSRGVQR